MTTSDFIKNYFCLKIKKNNENILNNININELKLYNNGKYPFSKEGINNVINNYKKIFDILCIDFSNEELVIKNDKQEDEILDFDNVELMEYTGLKDINGKEIYEGDIVNCTDMLIDLKFKGVFKFNNGSFYISDDTITHYRLIDYSIEVIDNIYKNPKLLESE